MCAGKNLRTNLITKHRSCQMGSGHSADLCGKKILLGNTKTGRRKGSTYTFKPITVQEIASLVSTRTLQAGPLAEDLFIPQSNMKDLNNSQKHRMTTSFHLKENPETVRKRGRTSKSKKLNGDLLEVGAGERGFSDKLRVKFKNKNLQ